MTIGMQNQINETIGQPQSDEGSTELCFALPPSVANALARYTESTGCSWDDAATRAIALLMMQTGYADRDVNREYLNRTFQYKVGGAA